MQETFWGNHFYGILPENRHFHAKQLEKYQTWLIIADIWIIWTGYFHLHKLKKKSPDRLIWIVLAANATLLACFFFVCFVLHFIVSDGCSSESREKQKSRGSDPWNATVPVNGDRKHHKERQKIRHAKLHMTGFHLIIVVFKVVWILKYINHSLLWIFVLFSDAL